MSIGFLASIKAGINTLTGRLTSGRATALDNLDATVSSRAAASTALSSATWTGTRAGYLDKIGIKSIQQGTITVSIATNSGSNTATISSVDTSKAVCLLLGFTSNSTDSSFVCARVALTNATTVTANANHAPSGSVGVVVSYVVIEFNG